MRETIRLAGRLEPGDLTPQQRDEFVEVYRRWRTEGSEGSEGSEDSEGSEGSEEQ